MKQKPALEYEILHIDTSIKSLLSLAFQLGNGFEAFTSKFLFVFSIFI